MTEYGITGQNVNPEKEDVRDETEQKRPELAPCRFAWRLAGRTLLVNLALLLVLVIAAIGPYYSPPAAQPLAEDWHSGCEAGAADCADWVLTGPDSVDLRLRLIANAQESIDIGTYMFRPDQTGTLVMASLMRAAERGVRVRIIIDGLIGGINMKDSPGAYLLAAHPLIEIRQFNPVNLLDLIGMNVSYHEKYMIVDGEWLILGGRNVSDQFLLEEDPTYSVDMEVVVRRTGEGTSAVDLADARFEETWNQLCCIPFYEDAGRAAQAEYLRDEWEELLDSLPAETFTQADSGSFCQVERSLLLVTGLSTGPKEPLIHRQLTDLALSAREEVMIISPYFILDRQMTEMMEEIAAADTGLTLVTNGDARGNNRFSIADRVFHRGDLDSVEAARFETQAAHSLHIKAMIIDRNVSVIGSYNYDPRSAYIDTEMMLVLESEELTARFIDYMESLLAVSTPVNDLAKTTGREGVEELATPFPKLLLSWVMAPVVWLIRPLI